MARLSLLLLVKVCILAASYQTSFHTCILKHGNEI